MTNPNIRTKALVIERGPCHAHNFGNDATVICNLPVSIVLGEICIRVVGLAMVVELAATGLMGVTFTVVSPGVPRAGLVEITRTGCICEGMQTYYNINGFHRTTMSYICTKHY